LHIWKEHVEIDQITNFHEKINWRSLLYRIPLRLSDILQNCPLKTEATLIRPSKILPNCPLKQRLSLLRPSKILPNCPLKQRSPLVRLSDILQNCPLKTEATPHKA
jgi:hypothetical protein